MTLLSSSTRRENRQKFGFDQFFASRTHARSAKFAFHQAKLSKPLVHRDGQHCGTVLIYPKQPVPFVIRKILARDHSQHPFESALRPFSNSTWEWLLRKVVAALQVEPTIQLHGAGVVSNLPIGSGTGGGSVAQERAEIEFSANPEKTSP